MGEFHKKVAIFKITPIICMYCSRFNNIGLTVKQINTV